MMILNISRRKNNSRKNTLPTDFQIERSKRVKLFQKSPNIDYATDKGRKISYLACFSAQIFRNLEKGTEESAAHSDSLGNRRKSGEFPICGSVGSPCKFELFSIYLHLS